MSVLHCARVLTFDLGGTWFRSAVVDSQGRLRDVRRTPAFGRATHPDEPTSRLQQRLVQWVLDEVTARAADLPEPPPAVGISLGAAVHGTSGLVLASAPMWGADAAPFDFAADLRAARPDISWTVVNDVSAAALALASSPDAAGVRKLAAVTLSTGIALRTIDVPTGRIATDRDHGLQGEIGHLPVEVTLAGRPLSLECDCGAANHLSAFLSGRGIPHVLCAAGYAQDARDPPAAFAEAVRAGSPDALSILDAITLPLARILLDLAVLDPHCEMVVLYGGVASAFGEPLRASLLRHLDRLGLYGAGEPGGNFFARRIRLAESGDYGMQGAALAASVRAGGALSTLDEHTLRVTTAKTVRYDVRFTQDVFDPANPRLAEMLDARPGGANHVVVVDSAVAARHAERIRAYFDHRSLSLRLVEFPGGEQSKTIDEMLRLIAVFGDAGVPRRGAPIAAVGGGTTLDVVGLAASLFRRGTPYVRVPTTLVGLIDAGIGVKTAINLGRQKSRIGTYHPAKAVLDLLFLATLGRREIRNGLAEAVKIALVKDEGLFALIETSAPEILDDPANAPPMPRIVERCVIAMLEELASNLWEERLERVADFGHSFSPGIELLAEPPLLHGEAVAIDIAICSVIARNRGLLRSAEAMRILHVLDRCELPRTNPICTTEVLAEALEETTRHRDGLQRLPLPVGIGSAIFVNDVTHAEVTAAADELAALAPGPGVSR